MSINEIIEKDYIEAYKSKDSLKLGVLRLVKTAAKNKLVEEKRPHDKLSDPEMMDVLMRQAKQRQDSIDQYKSAGRNDLAEKEESELQILRGYLPQPLSDNELDLIIDEVITNTGVQDAKGMGKIISCIMEQYKGRVDGKTLSGKVKNKLSQKK